MIEFNKRVENQYHIHYSISMACNNRCSYCHVLDKLDNAELFDRDMFEKVITTINDFKAANPELEFHIFIKGGEPLLVVDRVIEFFERVKCERTHFFVFSNFNFKPGGSKITKLQEYAKNNYFSIIASVHESSNHEFVKKNIEMFKDIVEVHFLLDDKNVDFIYEYAKWLLDTIGVRPHHSYVVKDIRIQIGNKKIGTTDYTNEKVQYILQHSDPYDGDVVMGDKLYTAQEALAMDFKNISKKYWTICHMNQVDIGYDGTTKLLCEYQLRSHIDKGLTKNKVFCTGHTCVCGTDQYKELMLERQPK